MEGTHAPSPFEQLWERYRSLVMVVVTAILLALVGQFAWAKYTQGQVNEKWTAFAASLGAEDNYVESSQAGNSLSEDLEDVDMATLESGLSGAEAKLKPFFLMAIARKAMLEQDWDRASSALDELESAYPNHSYVKSSKLPVQVREMKKPDEDEKNTPRRKVEWEPAVEGSAVSLMRGQIATAKAFEVPARFAKPEIPADAPKVKFTMGDRGTFTVALMSKEAPKHCEAFLKLASEDGGYWTGIAVDEVRRGTELRDMPDSLHFGYESTKDEDRSKWTTTEPSEHLVDWEENELSHFEGALSARAEADGKSCANRLWFSVDDTAATDGSRVVFGYVVEGLEVLRAACEAGLSAQDEERGMGRPEEDIRITAVEVL